MRNRWPDGHTSRTNVMSNHADIQISASAFYNEFHGHKVQHLQALLPRLREGTDRLIWTAGDSSLDNKYWFGDTVPAVDHAYAALLSPALSRPDVTYWLNRLLQGTRTAAINTAVEATTLNERTFGLRPQDKFLRDNIRSSDVLIVSVGGNDIALLPCPCTIAAILGLICCLPTCCVENGGSCGAVPCDDCCCGCGPSLASCVCACPPCLGYFRHLFGTRIERYIEKLTSKTKPAQVLVCMIYYPDEMPHPGWAGPALTVLGYNSNPAKLQCLIRKAYTDAISRIHVSGTQIVPVPLFQALDGKVTSDYVARVEPSPRGGRKLAELLMSFMDANTTTSPAAARSTLGSSFRVPTTAHMQDRG